jgi:hypothetical protein
VTVPFRSPHLESPRLLFAVGVDARQPAAGVILSVSQASSIQPNQELSGDLAIVKTIMDLFGSLNGRALVASFPRDRYLPNSYPIWC